MTAHSDRLNGSFEVEDFVAARDAARGFSRLTEQLASGERRRVVIVHRNRPRAVMLSVEEYARLEKRC